MACDRRVVVIGAGVGGLAAAMILAAQGVETLVFDMAAAPGGKLREVEVEGCRIDAGPTVFTLREVFEELFAEAGGDLGSQLKLHRAQRLARHAWSGGARLDLYGDVEANADAIGAFAGAAEADGYRAFAARSARIYGTLRDAYIRAPKPNPVTLAARIGLAKLPDLLAISPFATLEHSLGEHFRDPRLRQLFGRYATYCGSSPYLAPATLMLVAHAEHEGVWYVEGGMRRVAEEMRRLAERRGARFRFHTRVKEIIVRNGRVVGVATDRGERFRADAVVFNGDVAALGEGLLGPRARGAAPSCGPAKRSLSAITWLGVGEARGFELIRHNVFFAADYAREFEAIFKHGRLPAAPTVYVCASDRQDEGLVAPGAERLFCLVNAPAGWSGTDAAEEFEACEKAADQLMRNCGLELNWRRRRVTTPNDFAGLFPATGGALYGPASHGWRASFRRAGSRTRLPGLYLAGGSVHPGPGLPTVALSGWLAAQALIADLDLNKSLVPAAMPGGISTPSATTVAAD